MYYIFIFFVYILVIWVNLFPHYFVGPLRAEPYLFCSTAGTSMGRGRYKPIACLSFVEVQTVPAKVQTDSGRFNITIFLLYDGAEAYP
jgi:hypothetical protein